MGEVLKINDVTVRRDGVNILDSVSWTVNDGERWVVLGPNGAGKTTTIRLVAGRLFPTSGEVAILGEKLGTFNIADIHPLVGLASSAIDAKIPLDQRVFYVVRTAAYGQLASWRESYDSMDDARAEALLAGLGVGELKDRYFDTLSSGERKRVGIARALMPNPEILILDEPTAGLDLGGRESLLATLTELASEDFAPVMVLVTHHVEEIPEGFTHALLLKNGVVHAAGPIDDVMTAPTLSSLFDLPLTVEHSGGRYTARLA